jgi:hypothetical protein
MPDQLASGNGGEPHIGEIRRLNQCKVLVFDEMGQTQRHAGAGVRNMTAVRGSFIEDRFIARD